MVVGVALMPSDNPAGGHGRWIHADPASASARLAAARLGLKHLTCATAPSPERCVQCNHSACMCAHVTPTVGKWTACFFIFHCKRW